MSMIYHYLFFNSCAAVCTEKTLDVSRRTMSMMASGRLFFSFCLASWARTSLLQAKHKIISDLNIFSASAYPIPLKKREKYPKWDCLENFNIVLFNTQLAAMSRRCSVVVASRLQLCICYVQYELKMKGGHFVKYAKSQPQSDCYAALMRRSR